MKQMQIEGEYVRALIWDTAGQERFRTMTKHYYRGSQGLILVYDVTNPDSFLHVQNWMRDFKKSTGCAIPKLDARFRKIEKSTGCDRVLKILVGNKSDVPDIEKCVTDVEGQLLGIELDVPFYETSAKNGSNVLEIFTRLITDLVRARKRRNTYSMTPSPNSC